ncbi:hypothetical protein [Kineobactrum salinum]|uniref:Uncharacterized protein n=1 Tax=Kineobactrum salinum TaxID=2708301 RepID=A0A6C0U2N0_9GAMM|nr:hypothetical protein [Kineobactrum salinum]QIB65709.1 hypothetical protein G3T16_10070 [Kineobactrum salinum]
MSLLAMAACSFVDVGSQTKTIHNLCLNSMHEYPVMVSISAIVLLYVTWRVLLKWLFRRNFVSPRNPPPFHPKGEWALLLPGSLAAAFLEMLLSAYHETGSINMPVAIGLMLALFTLFMWTMALETLAQSKKQNAEGEHGPEE